MIADRAVPKLLTFRLLPRRLQIARRRQHRAGPRHLAPISRRQHGLLRSPRRSRLPKRQRSAVRETRGVSARTGSSRTISPFAAIRSATCNAGWMKIKRNLPRFESRRKLTMDHTQHHSPAPSNFCATHCMKCQGGFVRTTTKGATVMMCLVDREPVLANIASCNKFKPIEI